VQRFALPLGKVDYLFSAEGKILFKDGTHRPARSCDFIIRNTEIRLRPLIEVGSVAPDGYVSVRFNIKEDRSDAVYEIGIRLPRQRLCLF